MAAQFPISSIATVLVYGLNTRSGIAVGMARKKFSVKLPDTTGHPEFERAFRAHANNAEQYPQFLALMWLFASISGQDYIAGGLGLLWVYLRNEYTTSYHSGTEHIGSYTIPCYFILIFYSLGIVAYVVYNALAPYS